MRKFTGEVIPYDTLDLETREEVVDLYDRVQNENGGIRHPSFYSPDTIDQIIDDPNIARHYLAIVGKDRKSEHIVGHATVLFPDPYHTAVWRDGVVRFFEPNLEKTESTPALWELGGAVVEPKLEHRKIWSHLIERRLIDVTESLGGYAVSAVNQYHTDVMGKVSEFGGIPVGRAEEESPMPLNLIVFPLIESSNAKYVTKVEPIGGVNYLSSAALISEVDVTRRFRNAVRYAPGDRP